MSRIYANENFPRPVVLELRRLGHDVLTVEETGKADQSLPDEAVLKFAADDGRAVLTKVQPLIRANQTLIEPAASGWEMSGYQRRLAVQNVFLCVTHFNAKSGVFRRGARVWRLGAC